jgi:hypothetical protein
MDLILEQLLIAAAPLFLAAIKGKRKSAKKPVKRSAVKPRSVRMKKQPARAKKQPSRAKKQPSQAKKQPSQAKKQLARQKKTPPKPLHPAARKPELRGKKAISISRTAQVGKPAPPATSKPDETEPLPKPVAPTGRAILLSPENEKYADSEHPTFRWLSVGGATRYEIAWSDDMAMNSSHSIFSIATEATIPVEKPLRAGAAYHWHVRGGNESGWGPWSAVSSFRVLDEPT